MKKIIKYFLFLNLLSGCIFDFKNAHVYNNYYAVAIDNSNYNLSYKLDDGNFIERVPSNFIAYQIIGDSILIAKNSSNGINNFYFIRIKLDNGYSELQHIIVGPFDETSFLLYFKEKYNSIHINFKYFK